MFDKIEQLFIGLVLGTTLAAMMVGVALMASTLLLFWRS